MDWQTDAFTQALLRHYQRGFPLVSRPFQLIAENLSYTEEGVLSKLAALKQQDVLTRVGPIFDHKRAGASLLAAMSVPNETLDKVAEQINSFAEVNHNYAREHHFNLWFVVTAPDDTHLSNTLSTMEKVTGHQIIKLPMVKSYYLDLGFQISHEHVLTHTPISASLNAESVGDENLLCDIDQQRLRVLIQEGFPLVKQPFKKLANHLGFATESQVIATIKFWLKNGLIKRVGLVTNHHQLGYTSNAMLVWDVADDLIDEVGELIKSSGLVSLCYQRERSLPQWRYNLYCMIHSRDRESVLEKAHQIEALAELSSAPSEILYTVHQYKQKGGLYSVLHNQDHTQSIIQEQPVKRLGGHHG